VTETDIHTQALAWRKAEDKFYQAALNTPEVYTDGIRLVRALTNKLRHLTTPEELLPAYLAYDLDQIGALADELDLSHADFIDFELALDAAFYLRFQEILRAKDEAHIQTKLAQAQTQGAAWVRLYDYESKRQGRTFFQKLEMRLADGLGLYTAVELDYEKGRLYVLEAMQLDPTTAEPLRGGAPLAPRQEFRTREELAEAVAKLKRKYDKR
jgi:hypothetical protein